MTWKEAQIAFRKQVPVIHTNPVTHREPILCIRIFEVAVRCDTEGHFYHVVGGMDPNKNTVYHGSPEQFAPAED